MDDSLERVASDSSVTDLGDVPVRVSDCVAINAGVCVVLADMFSAVTVSHALAVAVPDVLVAVGDALLVGRMRTEGDSDTMLPVFDVVLEYWLRVAWMVLLGVALAEAEYVGESVGATVWESLTTLDAVIATEGVTEADKDGINRSVAVITTDGDKVPVSRARLRVSVHCRVRDNAQLGPATSMVVVARSIGWGSAPENTGVHLESKLTGDPKTIGEAATAAQKQSHSPVTSFQIGASTADDLPSTHVAVGTSTGHTLVARHGYGEPPTTDVDASPVDDNVTPPTALQRMSTYGCLPEGALPPHAEELPPVPRLSEMMNRL